MKMEVFNDYLNTHDIFGNLEESFSTIDNGYLATFAFSFSLLNNRNLLASARYSYIWSKTTATYNSSGLPGSELWYQDKKVLAHIISLGAGYRLYTTRKMKFNLIAGPSYIMAYLGVRPRVSSNPDTDYSYAPGKAWGYFIETNANYNFWKKFSLGLTMGYRQARVREMKNYYGGQYTYRSNEYEVTPLGFQYKVKPLELDFSGVYGKIGVSLLIH